ncbi:MAG: hypothetical protein D6714_08015 [Bacteroidetes bacterium]|nr:MAG: hypothetical protein D6714_08015 [Bacteroidota bacterium]
MSCAGCSVKTKNGTPAGCGSKGNCLTGGCNKLNTFDWLSTMDIHDVEEFPIVEVSFKNGARKGYYVNALDYPVSTGDMVVVEAAAGYDVGKISLSGDLVRLQLKKRKLREEDLLLKIIRRANQRDLEKLEEARQLEYPTMVRARAIARTLGLEMKIGDVEYQGDRRKATFYYTADGRVDFRELIRHYAKEFRVKIEMRQIGARQESARVGGIGSCGRELCCSTWLSDFKSVSTAAARYQNLAINQAKLSGQCGRLKCCLNYELDTYMEALEQFPENADKLKTEVGVAILIKTDIFKGLMYYAYEKEGFRGKHYPLSLERVHEIKALNDSGKFPTDLVDIHALIDLDEEPEIDFRDDVTGVLELPPEEKKKRRRRRRNKPNPPNRGNNPRNKKDQNSPEKTNNPDRNKARTDDNKPENKSTRSRNRRRSNRGGSGRNKKSGGGGNRNRGNRGPKK